MLKNQLNAGKWNGIQNGRDALVLLLSNLLFNRDMKANKIEKKFLIVGAFVGVIPFVDRKFKHLIKCLMLNAPCDEHQQNHGRYRHEHWSTIANEILLSGIPQKSRCVPWYTTNERNSNWLMEFMANPSEPTHQNRDIWNAWLASKCPVMKPIRALILANVMFPPKTKYITYFM